MNDNRMSYKSKLLQSHFIIAALGSALLLTAIFATIAINKSTVTLTDEIVPTRSAAETARTGLQRSLAAMRAWVNLEDSLFKQQRNDAWLQDIYPSLHQLESMSKNWSSSQDLIKLNQVTKILQELAEWQWAIEDVAHTPGNTPAKYYFNAHMQRSFDQLTGVINNALYSQLHALPAAKQSKYDNHLLTLRTITLEHHAKLALLVHDAHTDNTTQLDQDLIQLYNILDKLKLYESPNTPHIAQSNKKIEHALNHYRNADNQVRTAVFKAQPNIALHWLATEAIPRANLASSYLDTISNNQKVLQQLGASEVHTTSTAAIYLLLALFAAMIIAAWYISVTSARKLTVPLATLTKASSALALGELKEDIEIKSNDEVGDLANAFNIMRRSLQNSLTSSEHQQRLQQRLSQIHNAMLGNLSLEQIGNRILHYIVTEMDLHIGVLYFNNTDTQQLICIGEYGVTPSRLGSTHPNKEGLVGQAVYNQHPLELNQLPNDSLNIRTTLSNTSPNKILIYPITLQDQTVAVFELATISHHFHPHLLELLETANRILAIGIKSTNTAMQAKHLLVETQKKSEELATQQEALSTTNKQLEKQAHRLKQSEEELRQQSEELRVNNEQLHEKQSMLERQKSELEEAHKDIEQKVKELNLANKYKSEFLANMSHELRTPLNSFLILSRELASNTQGNLTEAQVNDAKIIYEGGTDLLDLINDIMDLSKVEAGMLAIDEKECDLRALCETIYKSMLPFARDKNLDFHINIAPNVPTSITTDPKRLSQILKNFISNAIKFTSRGSVTLAASCLKTQNDKQYSNTLKPKCIALSVSDTGIGIEPDKQQLIFDAFQQEDGSTTRSYGGTGLGLSISKELTALLNGQITIDSKKGEGSTFSVLLPLTGKEKDITPSKPAPAISPLPQSQELEIKDDRELAHGSASEALLTLSSDIEFTKHVTALAHAGNYLSLIATSEQEAVALAQAHTLFGVIVDYLPDTAVSLQFPTLHKTLGTESLPFFAVSTRDEKVEAIKQGAIGFLSKPINSDDLSTTIRNLASCNDRRNILVVEDNPTIQMLISELLHDEMVIVVSALNGTQACDLLATRTFDCLILDLGLPDMDGMDVLRYLDELDLSPPPVVIVHTGRDISDNEHLMLAQFTHNIILKGTESPARIVDEVAVFLRDRNKTSSLDAEEQQNNIEQESELFANKRALLVDDDMRNAFALNAQLQKLGLHVDIADNGLLALKKIEQEPTYHIILMDIMMPVMDGYETIQKIREKTAYQKTPILALTAKAMPEEAEKCISAGASEYITKPLDIPQLINTIRIWLYG